MLFIYYAKRKVGRHGFLILADRQLSEAEKEQKFPVKELHFRTSRPLPEAALELVGLKKKPKVNKPLRLTIETRMRKVASFELVKIAEGANEAITEQWLRVIEASREIDSHANFTDGTHKNCHTFLFDALEQAGLPAPRDKYQEWVAQIIKNEDLTGEQPENLAAIHPPIFRAAINALCGISTFP